jgi:hypothetical protein
MYGNIPARSSSALSSLSRFALRSRSRFSCSCSSSSMPQIKYTQTKTCTSSHQPLQHACTRVSLECTAVVHKLLGCCSCMCASMCAQLKTVAPAVVRTITHVGAVLLGAYLCPSDHISVSNEQTTCSSCISVDNTAACHLLLQLHRGLKSRSLSYMSSLSSPVSTQHKTCTGTQAAAAVAVVAAACTSYQCAATST